MPNVSGSSCSSIKPGAISKEPIFWSGPSKMQKVFTHEPYLEQSYRKSFITEFSSKSFTDSTAADSKGLK